MKSRTPRFAAAGVLFAAAIANITACAPAQNGDADGEASVDTSKPVTIAVEAYRPGTEKKAIDAIKKRADAFMKKNPQITVKLIEHEWNAEKFASELAGGTLPTVFTVPFTDGRTLIANKQVADISGFVDDLPYADKFNPNVAAAGEDEDGRMWLVPTEAYAMGLTYNRQIFEEAGLDPDTPPQTWDEIRTAAKTIAETTGKTGFATMTSANAGGWLLTTYAYARGGRMETGEGDDTKATVDTPQNKEVLELLKAMRWEDDSMGADFLYEWGTINAAFAAGKIGMFVGGSDLFGPMTSMNSLDPDIYGLTTLPVTDDENAGALGGGSLAAVSAKATPEEQAAAVAWIDYNWLGSQTDEDLAVENAKIRQAAKQPVGVPGVPLFDQEMYDTQREWISDYINVPLAQYEPFINGMFDMQIVPEPKIKTQALYGALDPLVQKVLTDKSADIDALLQTYQANAEGIVGG